MKLSPVDIQQMVFKTGWRGYDRSEVDRFLENVAQAMGELGRENAGLRDRLAKLEAELAEVRKSEHALNRTLLSTQSLADELKQAAQRDANLIKREAELKAAESLREAQGELTAIQRELSDLRKQRLMAVERMRATLQSFQRMVEIESADAGGNHAENPALNAVRQGNG
jgi:cell division initiation protein